MNNINIIILILVQILLYKWVTFVKYVSIKPKCKYKHLKLDIHKELDRCQHVMLLLRDIDMHDVDRAFYSYIIEHNKKYDYYLIRCQFTSVLNIDEYRPYVTSKLSEHKTMISWSSFLERVIDDFKNKGYTLNYIAEMHIITIANKLYVSYNFYIKHHLSSLE